MSEPAEYTAPARDAGDGFGQAVLSMAIGLLVVGLVVALRLTPSDELRGHIWWVRVWTWGPFALFAVAAGLRGRSVARGIAAFVLMLAVLALDYWWQTDLALEVYTSVDLDSTVGGLLFVLPSATLVFAFGLVWGVARRRGLLWVFGPLVAAIAWGVASHEYLFDPLLPDEGTARDVVSVLLLPAAIWLGCLIGWALDRATRRDRSTGRVYPAMGHSDSPYSTPGELR